MTMEKQDQRMEPEAREFEGIPDFAAPRPAVQEAAPTILFADDNTRLLDLFGRHLQELMPRWRVLKAHSYREAKTVSSLIFPSAAVLDVELGDGNGFDLMADLRAIDPLLAVVMISGRTRQEAELRAARGQVFTFMEKPFSIPELIVKVEAQMNASRLASPGGAARKNESVALARLPEHRMLALRDPR